MAGAAVETCARVTGGVPKTIDFAACRLRVTLYLMPVQDSYRLRVTLYLMPAQDSYRLRVTIYLVPVQDMWHIRRSQEQPPPNNSDNIQTEMV